MSEVSQATNIQHVALALLTPSPTEAQAQRRKHFDKVGLQQLADSMKSVGLVNPILVRPLEKGFEIVAGERRFQAAKIAGLETVPVSVRELDDGQVLELQLIENLQRQGLHELHEAEGYEQLRKRGINAVQIAEKVGKSREYVFTRLKLLALCKEAKAAFYDSKLTFSTALLIARIPGEKMQKEALKELTNENRPMSFRQAQEFVQNNFMLRLGDAPFDAAAENLVKGAMPCARCPKNTLAQPELFGDVKAGSVGVCTDPPCFQSKVAAAIDIKVKAAEGAGQKVIEGGAAKKIFPYGTHYAQGGFKKLDGEVWVGGRSVPVKSMLKEGVKPTLVRIVDENDDRLKLIEVVPESALKMPKRSSSSSSSSSRSSSSKVSAADKAREEKANAERKLLVAVAKAIHTKAPKPFTFDELFKIAETVFESSHGDDALEIIGSKTAYPQFDKLNEAGLQRAIRGMLLAAHIDEGDKGVVFAEAKRHGVDVEKIKAELAAPAADKAKPAAAKGNKAAKTPSKKK
jgi:ParB/RepB/Spo0J family partition protein